MNFKTAAPTLARMDQLEHDVLVIAHFNDERPLRGIGGLVDWRLNGKLSRFLLDGFLTGEWGEQVMYPQGIRLPFSTLLYFGLGDRDQFSSARFREVSAQILRTVMRLGIASIALGLPGRGTVKLVPRQLIDLWLGELQKVWVGQRFHDLDYDITFLEPPDVQSEIKEPISAFVRQHGQGRGTASEWRR
ncbi:MAG: hypothetical protein ACI9OJ_000831 [Myxococcota bacterium]|jgi:hypothetical protein